jgi:hypothetical protein
MEDVEQTLGGLIASTRRLIDDLGSILTALWRWRRANPTVILQPATQWRDGVSTDRLGFPGYAPGSYRYTPSMMMTHPVVVHRMRSAALDDAHRGEWPMFD